VCRIEITDADVFVKKCCPSPPCSFFGCQIPPFLRWFHGLMLPGQTMQHTRFRIVWAFEPECSARAFYSNGSSSFSQYFKARGSQWIQLPDGLKKGTEGTTIDVDGRIAHGWSESSLEAVWFFYNNQNFVVKHVWELPSIFVTWGSPNSVHCLHCRHWASVPRAHNGRCGSAAVGGRASAVHHERRVTGAPEHVVYRRLLGLGVAIRCGENVKYRLMGMFYFWVGRNIFPTETSFPLRRI